MNNIKNNLGLQTLLIIAAALLFLLPQLSFYPLLPPDEARYVEIPREMVASNEYIVPRLNGVVYLEKPPLFYWLQTLPIKMFGMQEAALRFWNAFFAALTIGFVFLAGSLLYNRKTGLVAAGMLYSSLMFYALAHVMSLDMTLSGLLSCSLLSFLLGLQHPPNIRRRWWFYAGYIFAALAVMTKGLVGLLLPSAIVFLWLLFTNSWRALLRAYIPSGLIILFIIIMPWHIVVQQRVPEFFDFYIVAQHFTRYLTMAEQRYEPIWWFVPVLAAGLLPWLPWVASAIYKQCREIKLQFSQYKNEMFLLIWAAFVFIFFSVSKSKLIPYILPVLPPLFLITANILIKQQSKLIGRRGMAIGMVSIVLLTALIPWWVKHSDRSIKPLAQIAQTVNYDEAVSYGRYYQDIPVYLGHTVTLVGSLNELRFGTTLEDVSEQYPSYKAFWARWNDSGHRMIVFLSRNKYDDFLRYSKVKTYTLGETSRVIIVSNFSE